MDTFSEGGQSNSRASLAEVPLPNGYEVKRTAQGQIYFLHSPTGVTTWHDPRVPKDLLQVINPSGERSLSEVLGPFPSGWEERSTRSNRSYFVDHAHRTTQFTDPRWDLKTFFYLKTNSHTFLPCSKAPQNTSLVLAENSIL